MMLYRENKHMQNLLAFVCVCCFKQKQRRPFLAFFSRLRSLWGHLPLGLFDHCLICSPVTLLLWHWGTVFLLTFGGLQLWTENQGGKIHTNWAANTTITEVEGLQLACWEVKECVCLNDTLEKSCLKQAESVCTKGSPLQKQDYSSKVHNGRETSLTSLSSVYVNIINIH